MTEKDSIRDSLIGSLTRAAADNAPTNVYSYETALVLEAFEQAEKLRDLRESLDEQIEVLEEEFMESWNIACESSRKGWNWMQFEYNEKCTRIRRQLEVLEKVRKLAD